MASIKIPNLPGVRSLINGTNIVASAEKAQIQSISVERGNPGTKSHAITELYSEGKYVDGLHPSQRDFIFNLVAGGLGSGRGDRPTSFAQWCVDVQKQYSESTWFSGLAKYNVIMEYGKRGGTMVYPVKDLLNLCEVKARNTQVSHERFPPERKPAASRTKEPETVEVSLVL